MTERSDVELTKLAGTLMGWTWHERSVWVVQPDHDYPDQSPLGAWERHNLYAAGRHWNPLESIADAWMLVEKSGGMWICPAENGHGWRAGILAREDPGCEAGIYADEAPRAITLAFISAMANRKAR